MKNKLLIVINQLVMPGNIPFFELHFNNLSNDYNIKSLVSTQKTVNINNIRPIYSFIDMEDILIIDNCAYYFSNSKSYLGRLKNGICLEYLYTMQLNNVINDTNKNANNKSTDNNEMINNELPNLKPIVTDNNEMMNNESTDLKHTVRKGKTKNKNNISVLNRKIHTYKNKYNIVKYISNYDIYLANKNKEIHQKRNKEIKNKGYDYKLFMNNNEIENTSYDQSISNKGDIDIDIIETYKYYDKFMNDNDHYYNDNYYDDNYYDDFYDRYDRYDR